MGARPVNIRCASPECGVEVARATLSDNTWIWEIALDDSVKDAKALHNGMGIGDFGSAKVLHETGDGDVARHTVVAWDYQPG